MERIKKLSRYQQGVLLLMMVMSIVFLVLYARTISRVGFEYRDTIFVPSQENGSTVYSGTINGQQARFTVSEDQMVVYQYGEKTFGPYFVTSEGVVGGCEWAGRGPCGAVRIGDLSAAEWSGIDASGRLACMAWRGGHLRSQCAFDFIRGRAVPLGYAIPGSQRGPCGAICLENGGEK